MTCWHFGSSLHFGIGWKKDHAQGDKDHHIPENSQDYNMNILYFFKKKSDKHEFKVRRTGLLWCIHGTNPSWTNMYKTTWNCWSLFAPWLPLLMKSQVCLSNDRWWTCIGHGTEAKAMRTIMDWKMELSSCKCNLFKPPNWIPIQKQPKLTVLKRAVLGSGHNLKFAHGNVALVALGCPTNHVHGMIQRYLKNRIHKKYLTGISLNVLSFELQWQTYSKALAKDAPPLQATPGTPSELQRMIFYMALPFLAKLKNVEAMGRDAVRGFFNLAC